MTRGTGRFVITAMLLSIVLVLCTSVLDQASGNSNDLGKRITKLEKRVADLKSGQDVLRLRVLQLTKDNEELKHYLYHELTEPLLQGRRF